MKRFALLAVLLAAPASAQDARDIDIDEIEHCLGEVGYTGPANARECIGFVADSCQEGGNASEPGNAADCTIREAAAWIALGARRFETLQQRTKPEIAALNKAAQKAWTVWRDAQCNATGAFFYQYSGSASAEWQAQCLRDLAAERAIQLDDWATRAEDFE